MSPLNRILRHKKRGQLNCPICNEPVSLETSKTDEDGHAIHEECYASKVCSKGEPAGNGKKTGTSG
jgi:hypothetical protein